MWSTIYVGSNKQPVSVMMDTGSPWVWVSSGFCLSCPGTDRFDNTNSTSYKFTPGKTTQLRYGSGTCDGFLSQDQICISNDDSSCSKDFTFLNVMKS